MLDLYEYSKTSSSSVNDESMTYFTEHSLMDYFSRLSRPNMGPIWQHALGTAATITVGSAEGVIFDQSPTSGVVVITNSNLSILRNKQDVLVFSEQHFEPNDIKKIDVELDFIGEYRNISDSILLNED